MKTAMQEAIEYLRKYNLLSAAIILEDKYLEKEKEQIIQAASCGYFEAREGQHDPDCYGIEYFETTYENNTQ